MVPMKRLVTLVLIYLVSFTYLLAAGNPRLVEAAKRQDRTTVNALLKLHLDANTSQGDGVTALHWAAHWDDSEMARSLILSGANTNAADDLGVTPLSLACTNASVGMIEKLLAAKANASAVTITGESVLMTCARSGNPAAVKALLVHGANVNAKEHLRDQTALMWAVAQRHPEVVEVLLEYGADFGTRSRVNQELIVRQPQTSRIVCPADISEEDRHKLSYKAQAMSSITSGISRTLEVACDRAEMAPEGGSTALLFAARAGDVSSAKLLLAAGANVNESGPDGSSVLVTAAYAGQGEFAEFLLSKGANPNALGAGYGALHAAVLRSDLGLVKALLAHGANPNIQLTKGTPVLRETSDFHLSSTLEGATPLFEAARFAEVEIVHALAAAGADPLLSLNDGTSPLMAAAGVGWAIGDMALAGHTRSDTYVNRAEPQVPDDDRALAAVKLMLSLGASVNVANQQGNTALHGAAAAGYPAIVQLLVDHDAKLDAQNKLGQTALTVASKNTQGLLRMLGAGKNAATSETFEK